MRWLGVLAAIVVALALVAATTGTTPAAGPTLTCAKGSVRAVIGGKQSCLKVGQRCSKRLDRQYHRNKFHCHSGRLTRQPPVPLTPVTITLHAVDGSGVTGTATLAPLNANNTKVTVELVNQPPGALPAHIHFDKCSNPSTIRFSLLDVVDGRSESTVGAISYVRRGHGAFSINVHRAEPDLPIIACGDIPPA